MMRESDYHRSAYVRMCQIRNDDRKRLIAKIKEADMVVSYLCIRAGLSTEAKWMANWVEKADKKSEYLDGLFDAYGLVYGRNELYDLFDYLDHRRDRMKRLIVYMLRVKMGGEHK